MRYLSILLVLLLSLSCNHSDDSSSTVSCSGIEESEAGLKVKSFFYEKYANDKLLAVEKEEVLSAVNGLASFKVYSAYPFEDAQAWSLSFNASTIDVFKNLLIAESNVEGKSTSFEVFSLKEGNKLIDYTYDKFEVVFSSESEKRFLGFYAKNAANDIEDKAEFGENTIGLFTYMSLKAKGQKFLVNLVNSEDIDKFDIANPAVELLSIKQNAVELNSGKTLFFTGEDGLNPSAINFDIRLTFYSLDDYEPYSFILQVRNDELLVIQENFAGSPFVLEKLN